MNTATRFGLATLILTFSHFASAEELSKGGLFIEPMITYQTGETKISYPAPLSDSKEDVNGFGVGNIFAGGGIRSQRNRTS